MESGQESTKSSIRDAIIELDQFLDIQMPEKEVYLAPWLKAETITLITADRGTGKTWFAMSAALAVARGESFGPWEAGGSVPVLYLEGEMAGVDVQERILFLGEGHRQNHFYIYSEAHANQLGIGRAHLLDPKWQSEMKSALTELGVKLFVIDNISSLAQGLDENSKKDWDPINQWLLELRFSGIAPMMMHHTNKTGGQRGTHGRTDNIDISIVLTRPPDYFTEDGARFIASFDKNRVRHCDLPKIVDTEFQLRMDEQQNMVWTWRNPKKALKIQIIELKDEGYSNANISKELKCSAPYVGQVVKKAIFDGHLTEGGKLTPSGFEYVQNDHDWD